MVAPPTFLLTRIAGPDKYLGKLSWEFWGYWDFEIYLNLKKKKDFSYQILKKIKNTYIF